LFYSVAQVSLLATHSVTSCVRLLQTK
jgi:hypothetical protein